MYFPGKKTKHIFDGLIKRNLPSNLEDFIYVEPFGGTFGIGNIINKQVKKTVYNDIEDFSWISEVVKADVTHQLDYLEIIKLYDSPNTLFYLDPPYYNKEHVYGIEHSHDMHVELSNVLKTIKGKFIISYEDDLVIHKLYREFKVDYYNGEKQTLKKEVIFTNI